MLDEFGPSAFLEMVREREISESTLAELVGDHGLTAAEVLEEQHASAVEGVVAGLYVP